MAASSEATSAAWTRRTWVVFAVLAAGMLAALPWLVNPWHPAMPGARDAAMYLACAKSLVAGEGYAYLGEPFVIRPPGMSLLLAPIVTSRGFDFAAVNWMVSLFGVAAALAVFAWCVPRVGEWVAAALALALWSNGMFQEFCNRAMSDVPGLAALFGCLLVARWASRTRSWKRELVLGLAIGVSAYLRSATVLLVPALVLERVVEHWRERRSSAGVTRAAGAAERSTGAWLAFARRRLALLVLVPVLVIAPWSLRDARVAPREQVEQTQIASYSVGMWHVDPSDPNSPRVGVADVLARVPERTRQMLSLLGTALGRDDATGASLVWGALLAALAAVTWLRHWRAAELYLFGYGATIAVYFGFHERLALPIWALALIAAVEALLGLASRAPRVARELGAVLALAALVAVQPSPRAHWAQFEAQHTRYQRFCTAVAAKLPPDARVGAPFGWHFALYLDRPVWSLHLAWSRERDAAKLDDLAEKHRLDYVVLAPFDGASQELYPLLVARWGEPERVDVGYLFRRTESH